MEKTIVETIYDLESMLLDKNKSYGNSVGDPICVLSHADAEERIRVRIDDKLSRLVRGTKYPGDDDLLDIAGYFVLWAAIHRQKTLSEGLVEHQIPAAAVNTRFVVA